MKTMKYVLLLLLSLLMACSGGTNGGDAENEPAVREMQPGETQIDTIAQEGEVDTYHLRAAETNRFLKVKCEEKSSGSGVDLLVTVYEENANGQRVRVFGKHKPEDTSVPANLEFLVYIDQPKDLYITVRDLMDDDASTRIAYHLTVTYQDSADGNHDFSNAQELTIGTAAEDAIETIGEVDCFTFTPTSDGVYAVQVIHHKPNNISAVQLAISLYDGEGNKIQRLEDPNHIILAYLTQESAPYFVTLEDSDSMNQDTAATYSISVEPVSANEVVANDTMETATVLTPDGEGIFTANGAIDYASSSVPPDNAGDKDWYQFTIGQPGGTTTYHPIQLTINNGTPVNGSAVLRVIVYNATEEKITSHDFRCGADAYQNQFRTTNGVYYISVSALNSKSLASSAPYQIQLQPSDLNDAAEETDDNTANSAIALEDGVAQSGMISYHSDVDWYSIDVNTAEAKILSVNLTSDTSIVDYRLALYRGEQLEEKITDLNGSDGDTHLKTAIYIAEDSSGSATYHFKVCDAQNDEGSSVPYTITASIASIPGTPGTIAEMASGDVLRYYSEINEQEQTNGSYTPVELEIFSGYQPEYIANTDWLNFRSTPLPEGVTLTENAGTTTIEFPWITGYIDYRSDRDFFEIDFGKLTPAGTETNWYYDVQIQFIVRPGSSVEYVWKLYRDRNGNKIIMDNPTSPDGYKACAGDETPNNTDTLNMTTPTGDQEFWIGGDWVTGENSKFYLGISDFNYKKIPGSGDGENLDDNTEPDDDWGYDAPYYFKLTLTYHPGQERPE